MSSMLTKILGRLRRVKERQGDDVHDFSLNTGERQVGETVEDIRLDHRIRYQLAIDTINGLSRRPEPLRGLDVFCGTGYGSFMMATALGCDVTGMDGSAEAISHAQRYFSAKGVQFVHEEFPFKLPAESFDFVACFESMEHVEDASSLLDEIVGAMKHGATLFLSAPNQSIMPKCGDRHRYHFRHYSLAELIAMADEAGSLQLIKWYGQDLYLMDGGKIVRALPQTEMVLREEEEGQLVILVLRKS